MSGVDGLQLNLGREAALQPVSMGPRYLGPITELMTVDERGTDTLTITKHPVATGANITDHSYREPAQLQLRMMATNSFKGGTENYCEVLYAQLLQLQQSRITFPIQTGKRLYENMLIESLGLTTDEKTEHALMLTIGCREIIKVSTSLVAAPVPTDPAVQAEPQKTAAVTQSATKQAAPATAPPAGSWMAKAAALSNVSLEAPAP